MPSPTPVDRLQQDLSDRIRIERVANGIIHASAAREDLLAVVEYIRDKLGGRFVVSVGTDARELSGAYEVNNIFGLDQDRLFLLLKTRVDPADPRLDSITPLIPGANWAEREVRDMIGVHPMGHPDPRRLVLPDDWPQDVHPLRRDFQYNHRPEPVADAKPEMRRPPQGSSALPIGPFFPTLEEPAFLNLFVEGEQIVGMDYRGFFNHRGIEKLADTTLTYDQVPFLAERICGI